MVLRRIFNRSDGTAAERADQFVSLHVDEQTFARFAVRDDDMSARVLHQTLLLEPFLHLLQREKAFDEVQSRVVQKDVCFPPGEGVFQGATV